MRDILYAEADGQVTAGAARVSRLSLQIPGQANASQSWVVICCWREIMIGNFGDGIEVEATVDPGLSSERRIAFSSRHLDTGTDERTNGGHFYLQGVGQDTTIDVSFSVRTGAGPARIEHVRIAAIRIREDFVGEIYHKEEDPSFTHAGSNPREGVMIMNGPALKGRYLALATMSTDMGTVSANEALSVTFEINQVDPTPGSLRNETRLRQPFETDTIGTPARPSYLTQARRPAAPGGGSRRINHFFMGTVDLDERLFSAGLYMYNNRGGGQPQGVTDLARVTLVPLDENFDYDFAQYDSYSEFDTASEIGVLEKLGVGKTGKMTLLLGWGVHGHDSTGSSNGATVRVRDDESSAIYMESQLRRPELAGANGALSQIKGISGKAVLDLNFEGTGATAYGAGFFMMGIVDHTSGMPLSPANFEASVGWSYKVAERKEQYDILTNEKIRRVVAENASVGSSIDVDIIGWHVENVRASVEGQFFERP